MAVVPCTAQSEEIIWNPLIKEPRNVPIIFSTPRLITFPRWVGPQFIIEILLTGDINDEQISG